MRFMHRSRQPSSVLSDLCNDFSDGRPGSRRKRRAKALQYLS